MPELLDQQAQAENADTDAHAGHINDVVAEEPTARNERRIREAIRARAAALPVPVLDQGNHGGQDLFQSFFIGGFECASHLRPDRRRLDLIAATQHDTHAASDYRALAQHGIRTVRDGLRWHLIERTPGHYDWSSVLPMLRAARGTGTQVIWDLCHWGWPDHLDIWSPQFIDRFARFAGAVARLVRDETDAVPFFVPVNEISFWSWAGGDLGFIGPHARDRGPELKVILARAAIAAIEAIRFVEPRARIVSAEPAIHVIPRSANRGHVDAARSYTEAQFEALDLLSGRLRPELGGRPDYVDVVGVNVYQHNQWVDGERPVALDHPQHRPVSVLLADVHRRYGRPVFVAETGIEADLRPAWLRIIGHEVATAQRAGVPVAGLCLYPVTDYPGWDDERHCPTGLLGYAGPDGSRPVHEPLAQELRLQQEHRSEVPREGAQTTDARTANT